MITPMMALLRCLFVVVLCLPPATSYIDRRTYYPAQSESFMGTNFDLTGRTFGFKSGGELIVDVTCDGQPGYLAVAAVNLKQWRTLSDRKALACASSKSVSVLFPLENRTVPSSPPTVKYHIEEEFGQSGRTKFFNFLLLECPPPGESASKCTIQTLTLNPGYEHLSRDEIPLPQLYKVLTIIWACVFMLWILNSVYFWSYSNGIHRMLSLAVTVQLIVIYLEQLIWEQTSQDGYAPSDLVKTRAVLAFFENSVFFCLLMALSAGWCVIVPSLSSSERSNTILLPLLFFVTSCLTRFVHRYFLALSIIFVILMVVFVVRQSGFSLVFLNQRYHEISLSFYRRTQDNPEELSVPLSTFSKPTKQKITVIKAVRSNFIAYCIFWSIFGIASSFLDEHTWVDRLLQEILASVFYIIMMVTLRLRNFSPYEKQPDTQPEEEDIEVDVLINQRYQPFALLVPIDEKPQMMMGFMSRVAGSMQPPVPGARAEEAAQEEQAESDQAPVAAIEQEAEAPVSRGSSGSASLRRSPLVREISVDSLHDGLALEDVRQLDEESITEDPQQIVVDTV